MRYIFVFDVLGNDNNEDGEIEKVGLKAAKARRSEAEMWRVFHATGCVACAGCMGMVREERPAYKNRSISASSFNVSMYAATCCWTFCSLMYSFRRSSTSS